MIGQPGSWRRAAEKLHTPLGGERLAACVFRLPYRGEMVPMCHMNAAGVRERFYADPAW